VVVSVLGKQHPAAETILRLLAEEEAKASDQKPPGE
jgi:hypothetical protein